jgi:hypothetical protein
MAGFTGYRCWTPAGAADLPTEAVVASTAYFFATHAPLKIRRGTPSDIRGEGGEEVSEEAVWNDFLDRPTAGGVLLMPVIGESGTGKSHLVRWVWEKSKEASMNKRRVIYLPKNQTSLKAVVKALLAEVRNPELDQLRADVDRMTSELDKSGLEHRLLNHLQEALVAAPREAGPGAALVGPRGLSVLLLDPLVRGHLLRDDALIPKLAESLLRDRQEGEGDRTAEFGVDDLPLNVGDVVDASEAARRVLTHLKSSPERQLAAVRLLNEHVSAAVTNATNVGAGRLQSAMLQIRREFHQQGKEIVLLIEDFAVIQGFQRDLLDAIIEVGVRGGRTELAPIRTLMAVTTGYYARLTDTVMTRARQATPYVYNLDVQFNPKNMMDEAKSFVGRYLNAARVGRNALDAKRVGDDVQNACDDCAFKGTCHPAFGRSAEGYGLYPFNEPALRRAIRARRAPGNDPDAFNPRIVIGEVVRNVLREHGPSIADGTFPDRRFEEQFPTPVEETPLPTGVRSILEDQLSSDEAARYSTFLEFWGDAPATAVNLPSDLREAFGIGRLDLTVDPDEQPVGTGSGSRDGTRARTTAPKPPVSPPTGKPGSLVQALGNVENWATRNAVLPQGTANEIRGIIRNAVVERCAWSDPLMQEPNAEIMKRAWPVGSATIFIEDAYGQNEAVTAPINFTRSARNSVFFQGLLLADAGAIEGKSWATGEDITRAAEALRRLARYADLHQTSLQHAVVRLESSVGPRKGPLTNDQLALGIRASLIGATLAGRALPEMAEADLLAIVFDEGRDWQRGDTAWTTTLASHLKARPYLVWHLRAGLGLSRGVTGKVRMIDSARALPMLREAIASWQWQADSIPTLWVREAVDGFANWDNLLDARISDLASERDRVRALLPQGTSLAETVDAVRAAIENAVKVGVDQGDHNQLARIEDLTERAKQCDGRVIDRLERELAAAAADEGSAGQQAKARITAAARDRGTEIAGIREFLTESNHWLTVALKAARMRPRGAGTAADTAVRDLVTRWAAIDEEDQG